MAVREAFQQNKVAGLTVAVALFVAAAAIAAYTLWPQGARGSASGAFYSDDDGKSYFSDSIYHFPPYEKDGKTVYGAIVYKGSSGNFVGAIFRFKPEVKSQLEDAYAKTQAGAQPLYEFRQQLGAAMRLGIEYKAPGDGQRWYSGVPRVKSPDGGEIFLVMP